MIISEKKIKQTRESIEGLFCMIILLSCVLFLKYSGDLDYNYKIFETFEKDIHKYYNLNKNQIKKESLKKEYQINKYYSVKNKIENNKLIILIQKKLKKKECRILKNTYVNSKNIYFQKKNCLIYKKIKYSI